MARFSKATVPPMSTSDPALFTTIVGNVIITMVSALLFTIMYIAGTLVYIDLRVRKEGYNLDMMASEVRRHDSS